MPDPVPPAAGTPPDNPPAQGGNVAPITPPATPPAQQPGTPPAEFIVSQAQFDARWAEKMSGLEKELGLQPGGLKDFVAAQKAAKAPKPPAGEPLAGAELKLARMEALMLAKVPSERIPIILQHFNIAGKTREEIQASIQQLVDAKLLMIDAPAQQGTQQPPGPPNAAQGAGNPGVPGQPAKKTFTRAEVAENSKDPAWYEANRTAIFEAMEKGEIK